MIPIYPDTKAPDALYTFVGVKLAAALSVERCPPKRIAQLCGCSVSTVYRWRKRPDFKSLRHQFALAHRNERREREQSAREEFLRRKSQD